MPVGRSSHPPELSATEIALVAILFAASVLDDIILMMHIADINDFLLFDYGKKAVMFAVCLSMPGFRQVCWRAFAAPSVPWNGSGWLNPHVLVVMAGAFAGDQVLYQIGGTWNWHFGGLELYQVPPYREDVIKYLDLSFGLVFNSVVEELFYRAILLAALVRFVPHWGLRIAIAGLMFGAVHWSQGIVWVATISFLGCLFGYLYHLTRSIFPGIVVHTAHNLIAFTN